MDLLPELVCYCPDKLDLVQGTVYSNFSPYTTSATCNEDPNYSIQLQND